MGWTVQGSCPSGGESFSLMQNRVDQLQRPPRLLFSGYWRSFPTVKRPGCEAEPTSRAEVKNEWNSASTHPIGPRGVERDDFSVYLFV
jgi:hypothetical protein